MRREASLQNKNIMRREASLQNKNLIRREASLQIKNILRREASRLYDTGNGHLIQFKFIFIKEYGSKRLSPYQRDRLR